MQQGNYLVCCGLFAYGCVVLGLVGARRLTSTQFFFNFFGNSFDFIASSSAESTGVIPCRKTNDDLPVQSAICWEGRADHPHVRCLLMSSSSLGHFTVSGNEPSGVSGRARCSCRAASLRKFEMILTRDIPGDTFRFRKLPSRPARLRCPVAETKKSRQTIACLMIPRQHLSPMPRHGAFEHIRLSTMFHPTQLSNSLYLYL